MAADIILRSYGDVSVREDVVMNAIEILTARETQIYNMLGKSTAINTIHAYLTDTLNTLLKIIRGVYKFFLIDLEAEMPTGANPKWDAERLSERKFLAIGNYAIV